MPIRDDPARLHAGTPSGLSSEPPTLRGKHVLLIEDEPSLLSVLSAMLEAFGCVVWSATNAEQARSVAERELDHLDLVLTDILLGRGDNGLEIARLLRLERPDLPILYTSGYVGAHTCEALGLVPGENFLPKPFRVDDLRRALQRVLLPAG